MIIVMAGVSKTIGVICNGLTKTSKIRKRSILRLFAKENKDDGNECHWIGSSKIKSLVADEFMKQKKLMKEKS